MFSMDRLKYGPVVEPPGSKGNILNTTNSMSLQILNSYKLSLIYKLS